ncbi:MAG TPA: tetratricopeptide repeat protein, partial [Chloroflexota bacterium]
HQRTPHLLEPQDTLPLVGREAELMQVDRAMKEVLSAHGQIIAISADAGMGKSRVVAETVRRSLERQIDVHIGECQSYGTHISYLAWHSIWQSFFGLDDIETFEEQVRILEEHLAAIDPALVPRLPLLGVALNMPIPDNDLTQSLDAKLRKASLEALLIDCVRARAGTTPLLLVLEDCHWLDPLSHDLLEAIARAISDLSVLLVMAYRPPDLDRLHAPRITNLPWCTVVELTSFTAQEAGQLIALKLAQLIGEGAPPPEKLVERVAERAQGNPFYIEELLNYIHDRGLSLRDARVLESLDLPTSLHSLILSRIDQLDESQKITIKVASVIGRQFAMSWLWGADPQIGTSAQVEADLDVLSRLDLTPLDQPEPERVYLFKHIVTREVAYESLPYATRSHLHGELGQFIEQRYTDTLSQYVDLLAYHYDLSRNESKKREYLQKAGEAAQGSYANEAAVDYYRRLLPLLSDPERVSVLLRLGQVLELVGEWSSADDVYRQALELAEQAGDIHGLAAARQAVGSLLRKEGEYGEAVKWLTTVRGEFEGLGELAALSHVTTEIGEATRQLGAYAEATKWYDDALRLAASVEESGPRMMAQAQALKGAGTLANQQGDHTTARGLYQRSLALRRELGDRPGVAVLLANLGIVAYSVEDYAEALTLDQESLSVFREIGDRFSATQLMNNLAGVVAALGDYSTARELLTESVETQRQMGDKGRLAIALNSLADVLLDEGDYPTAEHLLVESLRINVEMGDRAAIAYLLDDFAALAAAEGDAERALQLAGAATAANDAIGYQVPAGERARFDRLQAPAWQALDKPTSAVAVAVGRAMTLERAVEYALAGYAVHLASPEETEAGVA